MGPIGPKGVKNMSNSKLIRKITATAMLTALVVVFQFIGNQIVIGPVSINLSLLPIAMGAILYGPFVGLFLGMVNGALVLLGPGMSLFYDINIPLTVLVCLLKTGLAGLISGLIFKLFEKKAPIPGMIIASLIVPVINTGIYIIACYTVFRSQVGLLISIFLLYNFLFEFGAAIILSPALVSVIKVVTKKFDGKKELKEIENTNE
jgi:thiamine transporter ThiT